MQATRRRDTAAELLVRSEVHRRGLRYRVDAPLPSLPRRRADLLFASARVAVFVDGCFWHGCPRHGSDPKSNAAYWRQKIAGNRARDTDTDASLRAVGWLVLRFWEHDDPVMAADAIEAAVRGRSRTLLGAAAEPTCERARTGGCARGRSGRRAEPPGAT